MSEEWITGGDTRAPAWTGGREVKGIPGVRLGADCRAEVLENQRARIALVGDFAPIGQRKDELLDAAADGRWTALTRLAGSYWVIAQNSNRRFVCGDLASARSIFHTADGHRWSTSARRLALDIDAAPDLVLLTARIVAAGDHWPTRTAYQGVEAVPGGFGLVLDGPQPELVDIRDTNPVGTLAGGASAFGTALEDAVHWRVREAGGTVGADVSGGLDSSSAFLLATEVGDVRAVTYSDPFTSKEDLGYARRVADHAGVQLHVGVGGQAQLPFTWSPSHPRAEQPVAASMTMPEHQVHMAAAAGLPLHLTGHGGDVVLDSSSAAWIGMVQTGNRRQARREVTGWARARNRAPRDLWRAILRAADTGRAGALEEAADRLEQGRGAERPGVWSWCHLGQAATWLTPAGRQQVADLLRAAAKSSEPERADLAEQQASLRLCGADARDTRPLATAWGVRPTHPFLDNNVVRAAFAIAPDERHGITSFKPLLAAALPQLPTWLTNRRSKGSFTRQGLAGMVHHQRQLADLIRTGTLSASGLLDPEAVAISLFSVATTQPQALGDLQHLATTCWWLAHGEHRDEVTGRGTTC